MNDELKVQKEVLVEPEDAAVDKDAVINKDADVNVSAASQEEDDADVVDVAEIHRMLDAKRGTSKAKEKQRRGSL